jgi:hypothetical protein
MVKLSLYSRIFNKLSIRKPDNYRIFNGKFIKKMHLVAIRTRPTTWIRSIPSRSVQIMKIRRLFIAKRCLFLNLTALKLHYHAIIVVVLA